MTDRTRTLDRPAASRRRPSAPTEAPRRRPSRPATPASDDRVVVDERLAQRRLGVAKAELRRRLYTLGALTAVTVIGIGAFALAHSSLLDVDEVVVRGARNADTADLVRRSGLELGRPLLDLDLGDAAEGVAGSHWIVDARAERHWNGLVELHVVEREPIAALPTVGGGWMWVDQGGRQLRAVDGPDPGRPAVAGVAVSGVDGEPIPVGAHRAVQVLRSLDPDLESQVATVRVEDDDHVVLELAAGGRILLGTDSGLGDKLRAARTMLASADLRCLGHVDVRIPSAPVVTRVGADGHPLSALANLTECA